MAGRSAFGANEKGDLAGSVGVEDSDGTAAGDDGNKILAARPRDGGETQARGAAARRGERAGDLRRV